MNHFRNCENLPQNENSNRILSYPVDSASPLDNFEIQRKDSFLQKTATSKKKVSLSQPFSEITQKSVPKENLRKTEKKM